MTPGRKLDEKVTVSPQININDLADIKAAGFTTIISNRPDGEQQGQPTADQVREAAEALGLNFVHAPVAGGNFTPEAIEAFKTAINTDEGKTFAFCRSGTRCATLWSLASAGERPSDEILERTTEAGYDLASLSPYLKAQDKS